MQKICLCLIIGLTVSATTLSQQDRQDDYGFLYWVHGWRGRSPAGERLFSAQTNRYVATVDVEAVRLTQLGRVRNPLPYGEAVSAAGLDMAMIPDASLHLEVTLGNVVYRCVGADLAALTGLESPSRIIEAGRYVQRFDIQSLLFETSDGEKLPGSGRLEIVAWPDRLHLLLDCSLPDQVASGMIRIALHTDTGTVTGEMPLAARNAGSGGVAFLVWSPDAACHFPVPDCEVTATDLSREHRVLPVSYDEKRGWFHVDLPEKQFDMVQSPEHQDHYALRLVNTSGNPIRVPLLFAFDDSFTGITGMTPLLFDTLDRPAGLPVQISKNWHRTPEAPELYEGPWFHGFALIPLDPGETWEGTLRIVYALWGGVPAVSHAQLCLIGWGVNQLWDQVAIGSWGETICYDPDINLNRSMIDDLRALMVHGMGGTPEKPALWTWTNNVGGGDFLTHFDHAGLRSFPSAMRTAYLRYGPNLSEVVYAGTMGDGAVALRVVVSSPRCDDVARAYHYLRYDVLKPLPFSRLAFYQLGADNYNDHQFNLLARGDRDGLQEEWTFQAGGRAYERTAAPCEGDAPWWFSAHQAVPNAPQGGAWANRGLIVREWDARIGGEIQERPHAAFFGTENHVPGMNIELAPPPGLKQLEPGDYVSAMVEVVVVPTKAAEYYGPNRNLRADLEANANTWKPIHRLARRNNLHVTVEKGEALRAYPLLLRADANDEVLFSVRGGAGHVPCTITGLRRPGAASLRQLNTTHETVVDNCVSENRHRQLDYNSTDACYELTFNLFLDAPEDGARTLHFALDSTASP